MGEVGGAVAGRHERVIDSGLGQGPVLEVLHLGNVPGDLVGGQSVPGLVEQGRSQVLGGGVALTEGALAAQLLGELGGHGLPGIHVARIGGQHLGVKRPLLVELAGELDDVAGHGRSGGRRVAGLGEQGVQSVPELVEARDDLVPRQQDRAGGGLLDVAAVDDDRLAAGER